MKIKLKVPKDVPFEFLSHGNLQLEIKGSSVTVEDRNFADWLVREHGFEIVDDAKSADDSGAADETSAVRKGGKQ